MSGQRRISSIDVDDARFLAGLRDAVGKIKVDGERGLLRIAIRIQNGARELCPVDTGRLRSSIVHVTGRDSDGPYVDVGTNVSYARYVEYGTSRAAAQPYLRPALAEAVGYAPRELGGA